MNTQLTKLDKAAIEAIEGEQLSDIFNEVYDALGGEKIHSIAEVWEAITDNNHAEEDDLQKAWYLIENCNEDLDVFAEPYKIDGVSFYPDMELEDLAEEFVEEGLFGEIPENIRQYLDYDKIASDLRYDYTYIKDKGCFRAV